MSNYTIMASGIRNDLLRRAVICVTLPLIAIGTVVFNMAMMWLYGILIACWLLFAWTPGAKAARQVLRLTTILALAWAAVQVKQFVVWVAYGLGVGQLFVSARRVW